MGNELDLTSLTEDGSDVYGRPISTATASLWGIEPLPTDEYRLTIITDLAAELGLA